MSRDHGAQTSRTTEAKLDEFERILRAQLAAAGGILSRSSWAYQTYLHFDLHAGPGRYDFGHGERDGSPLIFLRLAEARGIPYETWLFELHPGNVAALRAHVADLAPRCGRVHIIPGDNRESAPAVAAVLRQQVRHPAFGLIFADPPGARFDAEPMRTLLDALPDNRIDGLVHVSSTVYKRANGRHAEAHGRRDLRDDLAAAGKPRHWLRAIGRGQFGWTFAILTRWDGFPRLRGYVELGTPDGDAAADRLLLTEMERTQRYQAALPLTHETEAR